jgi:feruloyl esterase
MNKIAKFWIVLILAAWVGAPASAAQAPDAAAANEEAACKALQNIRNLTMISAELRPAEGITPASCYVRGLVSAIHYYVQLPLPSRWNGRLLALGDGGKDGDLDFASHRVAQGYAVTNSNTGHDNGSEPGASFGFNNRQAEIDFGYRAVHVTTTAAKTVIKAYYGKDPAYPYFEGCSTGGKEALMEAQRFPYDFDGIVGGAPVNFYTYVNVSHVFMLQKVFQNNMAGNLAYDADGDGVPESLAKLKRLHEAVIAKCDAVDGITDGLIQDPTACDFRPERDMPGSSCPGGVNQDDCFTEQQIKVIRDIYRGPYDSKGTNIYKGYALGSEYGWSGTVIPHKGNNMHPSRMNTSGDQFNYIFYDNDPGTEPPDRGDLSYLPSKDGAQPEFAWWEFKMDDVTAGKGKNMMAILDATDPDLSRMLLKKNAKLIIYHGWDDPQPHPEPTLDYYKDVVKTTFKGDVNAARERFQLFMIPGMGHCSGGPGPNEWDKLAPLVRWVEKGEAPNHVVAVHRDKDGKVDNERKICAYPQKAVYTGPAGGQNDRANWVEKNFTCK